MCRSNNSTRNTLKNGITDNTYSELTDYFRGKTIHAIAKPIHVDRPHIHILHLPPPSATLLCLRWLVTRLPSHLQNWLRHVLQAWLLPQTGSATIPSRPPSRAVVSSPKTTNKSPTPSSRRH